MAIAAVGEDALYVAGTDRHVYALIGRTKPAPLGEPLPEPPVALAPISNQRLAVVAGQSLHLLATADGRILQALPLPAAGTCVAADPTGTWLAVGTSTGTVAVFQGGDEFEPGESAKLHDGAVTALLFEADELRFFSGGADGKLLTTHARGALEPEDKGRGNSHTEAVTGLVLVPIGDRLVTGSRDKSLKNWPRTGATKPGTLSDGIGRVVALARVTDEDEKPVLAVLCDDATIRFLPLADDGRFDEDRFDDFPTVHGALAWAKNELASTWNTRGRLAAVKELAAWNDAAALDLLAAQADDKDAEVRATATKSLGNTGNPRAVTLLEPLLGHNDPVVRGAALTGLRSLLGPDDPRPLDLALATGKPEIGVRAVAALEVPARTDDQALAKVVTALAAPTWDVRKRAVAALEVVFDADPERATLIAAGATAGDVRALALRRAFDRQLLGRPAVAAAVRRRLEDDDPAVRHVAFLLSLLARPGLTDTLRGRDPELHRQLAELDKAEKPSKESGKLTDADFDVLLQAAASRALDTGLRGANALARLGDGRAFPLLLQLSRAEPEAARADVCRALAALGDHRAVARLRSLLLDPSPAVRDAAYTAVEKLSDNPLSAAEAGLTAAAEDVRRRGLQTLLAATKAKPPQTESDPGWGLFVRALDDPAAGVRREAFKAAVNQQVGGGAERTLAFTLRSSHADVRREALTEVQAQLGELWAPPLLLEFLDDPDPGLRAEAFALLTRKDKELFPLEMALRSRYPDARLLAVDALHKKHTADAQKLLLRAAADADPGVRAKAVAALIADDARPALAEALTADHADARVTAATALARLGDPAAGPALRRLAFAPEPADGFRREEWRTLGVAALAGLQELADPADFIKLLELSDSPHEAVRHTAAAALVTVTPAESAERVRKLLAHADPVVRGHAAATLAARGDVTVHPVLLAGDKLSALDRLAFHVAAVQPSAGGLASALDAADEPARRAALLVHLLLERAGTDGVPDLLLQALSAQAPRVRLAAAGGLEAFHDPTAFAASLVTAANDRGDDPAWKLTADVLDPLAAVLRYAAPVRRWQATHLLGAFADKESARFRQAWDVFRNRYAAEVDAAVAKLKPVKSKLTVAELRELAFGAYVGLVRSGDSARVRQTALSRLAALAAADKEYARAARPVFTQALGDPNQPVRLQAFDHLLALGLPAAAVGAEALEAGHTDLGVKGLELLSGGADSADGRTVLRRVMLGRTDELATEAAKLLAKTEGWVPVAADAVDAVSEPLRAEAVGWLAERFDQPAAKDALRKAVGSRYRPVREQVAFALARHKDPAAFDPLAALLREATAADAQERLAAALVTLGDKRAVGALLDRIETDPTGTADAPTLFEAVSQFRDPASADRLLALAAKRKEWQKPALNAALVVSGFDQDLPNPDEDVAAFERAERDQHPRHPAVLARLLDVSLALGTLPSQAGLVEEATLSRGNDVDPVLATLTANPDADVRVKAVAGVGWRAKHRGGPVEPLLTALKHKDPTTQMLAAAGLARVGRAEGLPVLLSGIESIDDVELRERAVLALGELADPRAVDTLLKLAAEDGHALQEAAAEAIGHLGKSPRAEEIGKLLERLVNSVGRGVAARAVVGLRHLNTAACWRLIRGRARIGRTQATWQVRQAVCEQLAFDPDPTADDLLREVLRTESDRDVLRAAVTAATRRSGPESVEPYYAAVQNESAATEPFGPGDRSPVDIVCDTGDPLRLLELFPKVPAEAQERIEASLTGRAAVPVAESTAALGNADAATVRIAARLLGGAGSPPAATKKALGEAVSRWWSVWQERRAAFDRTGDRDPLDAATATLQGVLWADVRVGAAGDAVADIAAARPDDPEARPVRLDALRTLASSDKPPVKVLEALASDVDAEVRTLAAAVLAKRDIKRATATLADHLSDRPTFARVLAAGVPAGDAVKQAAAKPHQQSVALPALVGAKDVPALAAVAGDKKAAEPARLGAVEGLGFMADEVAEAALRSLTADTDEDVRKAVFKALRRSKRARAKVTAGGKP